MPPHEIIYLFFVDGVQILKFVHGGKLLHIEPVWSDDVRLPLQEVLRFDSRDFRNCGERVRQVGRGALHAIPVIDTTLTGFFINVKLKKSSPVYKEKVTMLILKFKTRKKVFSEF